MSQARDLRSRVIPERQKLNVAAPQRNVSRPLAEVSASQPRKAWPAPLGELLGIFGVPTAVLDPCGDVIFANRLFAALVPSVVRELRGRPRFADAVADRLIAVALAREDSFWEDAAARIVPIRGRQGKPAAIAQLIPLQGALELPGAYRILVVTPVRPRPAPSPLVLQQLFGLSPAEARVASGLAGRRTLAAMADDFGVSRETVRSQIKTALEKTGTQRQLDLAVLLTSLQFPTGSITRLGDAGM